MCPWSRNAAIYDVRLPLFPYDRQHLYTHTTLVDGIGYDGDNDVIATSLSYLPTCRAVHNSKPDLANGGRSRYLKIGENMFGSTITQTMMELCLGTSAHPSARLT